MVVWTEIEDDEGPWDLRDPWKTALGKAYLRLFNAMSDALERLGAQEPFDAQVLLLNAQREAEAILTECAPLDTYVEKTNGRAE